MFKKKINSVVLTGTMLGALTFTGTALAMAQKSAASIRV